MSTMTFPGKELSEARKAKGKSMEDVYQDIHVPIQHLRALERSALQEMPGNTYGLGFLRTYCEYLDLDPAPYIDQYRLYTAIHPQRRRSLGGIPQLKSRPRWMGEVVTWGTLCAVLVLGWVTYSMVVRPWVKETGTRVDASTFEVEPEPLWGGQTYGRD